MLEWCYEALQFDGQIAVTNPALDGLKRVTSLFCFVGVH